MYLLCVSIKPFHSHSHSHSYHCPYCNYSSQIEAIIKRHLSTHYRNASPRKCENTRNNGDDVNDVASGVLGAGKSNVGQRQGNKDDEGGISKGDYSKERPHKCAICEKTFKYQGLLTVHQRVHIREEPYKCITCGKTFTRQKKTTHTPTCTHWC